MPSKTQSIVLGGLVVGLLSTSYLGLINFLCCAGVIIGSMVAVWHYTSTYNLTIPAGQGVAIGVLAAILGAVIAGILNYVLQLIGLADPSQLIQGFMEGFVPEEQLEEMQEQMEAQREAQRSFGAFIVSLLIGVVVSAVFGAIGGAIGASVFKKGPEGPVDPMAPGPY